MKQRSLDRAEMAADCIAEVHGAVRVGNAEL